MNLNQFSQDMKNKIVDTHCHLDFDDFHEDLDSVIANAKSSDVEYMLSISVNLEKFDLIHGIVKKYKNLWCSTGVHPNNVPKKFNINEIEDLKIKLINNISKEKVVGIGETGLDYFRGFENRQNQIEYFEAHMQLSGDKDLPIIIHTRDADQDTIDFLNKFVKQYNSLGLIHCFSSGLSLAKCALDNGFYISFSGLITFNKAVDLREIIKFIPIDRILVETDSPYLSPVPKRGKRNEPANVKFVLETISNIKNKDFNDIAEITTNNFFKLFKRAKNET